MDTLLAKSSAVDAETVPAYRLERRVTHRSAKLAPDHSSERVLFIVLGGVAIVLALFAGIQIRTDLQALETPFVDVAGWRLHALSARGSVPHHRPAPAPVTGIPADLQAGLREAPAFENVPPIRDAAPGPEAVTTAPAATAAAPVAVEVPAAPVAEAPVAPAVEPPAAPAYEPPAAPPAENLVDQGKTPTWIER